MDMAEEKISEALRRGASMAVEALDAAFRDGVRPEDVRAIASRLHELHDETTDLVMEAVARFGPVARDLRFLKGALFVSYDLYRVARYAYDIAAVAEKLGRECLSKKVLEIRDTVKGMVAMAVEMFLAGDASRLGELERLDDEVVDKAYEKSLDELLKGPDKCKVVETVVLRLLERASDHAVYIGNQAYYLVEGTRRGR